MSDKVVVVTGGAQGIGAATAKKLLQLGMKVAILDVCKEALEKATNTLKQAGGNIHSVVCDVSDRSQVFSAIENVKRHLGDIDFLVANAAVCNATPMSNLCVNKWLQVVDVNVSGVLHCVAAVLPDMITKKEGHIVFMSSIVGRAAIPNFSVYSGSKFFIQGYAAAIRQELASLGIKVTCIQPGVVNTNIFIKDADSEALEPFHGLFKDPENTMLRCEDIAEAISFCLTRKDRVGVNEITLERSRTIFQCN